MGYYSYFTLTVEHPYETVREQARNALIEMSGYTGWDVDPEEARLGEAKWYSWESHLHDVAKKFPSVLFTLHGEGEESGDIWTAWAFGDKIETGQINKEIPTPQWVQDIDLGAAERAAIEAEERATLAALLAKYPDAVAPGAESWPQTAGFTE